MTKRRISKQQAGRIQALHEKRRSRAKQQKENSMDESSLGPEQHGLVTTHYGASVDIENDAKVLHHCRLRQNIPVLVPGDEVIWQPSQDGGGIVTALEPRRSVLSRRDFFGNIKPIAANLDQVIVTTACVPAFSEIFIDRYLVAAESLNLEAIILLNKIDLLEGLQLEMLQNRLEIYNDIGYKVLGLSAKSHQGFARLIEALADKTSVFVGQSGVGKSSLVKAILPAENINIGHLSEKHKLGRHTTSSTKLYHLPNCGRVIDSPGVREFDLWRMTHAELSYGFPEFRAYQSQCKFRNCKHLFEPECAIKQAVADGHISETRLDSFHSLNLDMGAQAT